MVAIPDPSTFQLMPWREGETRVARMICDVVTPDGEPYEGDPRYVLRRALERMKSMGFDTFNVGPELEYFLFRDDKGTETLDEGRLLRDDDDGRGERAPPGDRARAGVDGDPDRVRPPRGRAVPARDRHALRAGAGDGRPHDDVPADRQGDREEGRLPRHLHAQADLRRERLGDAHAPVALHGRSERILRRGGPVAPLRRGQGIHRRPAASRTRDRGGLRAVGQLLQAARARLRGAGLHRVVTAEPLRTDSHPGLQARVGAGDAGRDPVPGSGVQSLSDVRCAPPRRPRGDRAGLRASRSRWRRTSTT